MKALLCLLVIIGIIGVLILNAVYLETYVTPTWIQRIYFLEFGNKFDFCYLSIHEDGNSRTEAFGCSFRS